MRSIKRAMSSIGIAIIVSCGEVPAPDCIEVSQQKLSEMQIGMNEGLTLRNAWAVKSGAHENAWFVSAEIDGPGLEGAGHVGTWFVTPLAGAGMILAVPEVATEFSQFGNASTTDAQATMSDAGARDSRRCVERHDDQ